MLRRDGTGIVTASSGYLPLGFGIFLIPVLKLTVGTLPTGLGVIANGLAKVGGGLAGHNGLRSITSHLSTQDYARVRIGVGKPASADEGADHVLRKVAPAERAVLDTAAVLAADVVESFILRGSAVTMNTYNTATS